MKECLLSGLLSVAGKKVLHLDRNPYYGGASASLTIDQLYQKFGVTQPPTEAELGKLRDYNIDLVPKFIMAGGQLVKVLIHTGVANYMEFKPVDGSFVYSSRAGKVCKVPATPEDAMKSSLMGMSA
jgi:Rab GDP dissociation inhibitor